MKKSKYMAAAEELIRAEDRIAAADLKLKKAMADILINKSEESDQQPSRPCANVPPPKQPPTK